MEMNVEALRQLEPGGEALERYAEIARLLTGQPHATVSDGVRWVAELCRKLEILRCALTA